MEPQLKAEGQNGGGKKKRAKDGQKEIFPRWKAMRYYFGRDGIPKGCTKFCQKA